VLAETRLSRHRRSSGSVFDGADVEVPVVVVDRDAVELGDLRVGVARADLASIARADRRPRS
jgi:sRNA-binding carbon storage regulator CsrA